MLKRYDELTEEQQKKVMVMYSDKSNIDQYLYNFDEHGNYHGRAKAYNNDSDIVSEEIAKTVYTDPKDEKPKAKRSHKK